MAKKDTHVTKDGRTVKKGLYYYMNRAKKKGTSKKGKGTVTDKALARSAKTAKKPVKKKKSGYVSGELDQVTKKPKKEKYIG